MKKKKNTLMIKLIIAGIMVVTLLVLSFVFVKSMDDNKWMPGSDNLDDIPLTMNY